MGISLSPDLPECQGRPLRHVRTTQMKENIRPIDEDKPLNETELETFLGIADRMVKEDRAALYSVPLLHEPLSPGTGYSGLLALYNEHCFTAGGFIAPMALSSDPTEKLPSACVGCRSCEAVCPQQIKISEAMADFTAKLGG